jgi:hypothetical protein
MRTGVPLEHSVDGSLSGPPRSGAMGRPATQWRDGPAGQVPAPGGVSRDPDRTGPQRLTTKRCEWLVWAREVRFPRPCAQRNTESVRDARRRRPGGGPQERVMLKVNDPVRGFVRDRVGDRVDGLAAHGAGLEVGAVSQDAHGLDGVGEVQTETGDGEGPGHTGLLAAVADLAVVAIPFAPREGQRGPLATCCART